MQVDNPVGERVVRFAPAPSGEGQLHLGHLWTCWFNFRIPATRILRVDDTNSSDFARSYLFLKRTCYVLSLFDFRFDRVALQSLRKRTHLSWVSSMREDEDFRFEGKRVWVDLENKDVEFYDSFREKRIRKRLTFNPTLVREDGTPTYHLASIADDVTLGVTDVMRSSDHVDNTAIHSYLMSKSKSETPNFWLLPLLYDQGGGKLSKSGGAMSLQSLLDLGYLPQGIMSYLEMHSDSKRPFCFDVSILRKCNREQMSSSAVESYLSKGYFPLSWRDCEAFSTLLNQNRYFTLCDFAEEINLLRPSLESLLDRYLNGELDERWCEVLNSYFNGEKVSLSLEEKIYFREVLLTLERSPSTSDCLEILLSMFNDA